MSWNVRQFGRILDSSNREGCGSYTGAWITVDAVQRLLADGGYSTDVIVADDIGEAIDRYSGLLIGIDRLASESMKETFGDVKMIRLIPRPLRAHLSTTFRYLEVGNSSMTVMDRYTGTSFQLDLNEPGPAQFLYQSLAETPLPGPPVPLHDRVENIPVLGMIIDSTGGFRGWLVWEYGYVSASNPESLIASIVHIMASPQSLEDAAMTSETRTVNIPRRRRRPKSTTEVSVIDIRPRRIPSAGTGPGGHRDVDHDHRWEVRGHWRNQPCGPGRSERRRIWIDGYVAGPDDRPLIRKNRVYRISDNSFAGEHENAAAGR